MDHAPQQMPPVPISLSYSVPYDSQLTIHLHTKHMWNYEYLTYNSGGQLVFNAKGKRDFSSRHLTNCDASNRPIVHMKHEGFNVSSPWEVHSGEEENRRLLFSLKAGNFLAPTRHLEVFLPNNNSTTPDFVITGTGIFKRKYTIHHHNLQVAEATKNGRFIYNVAVNPGLDLAFISTVVIIIDQVMKQSKGQHQAAHAAGGGL